MPRAAASKLVWRRSSNVCAMARKSEAWVMTGPVGNAVSAAWSDDARFDETRVARVVDAEKLPQYRRAVSTQLRRYAGRHALRRAEGKRRGRRQKLPRAR